MAGYTGAQTKDPQSDSSCLCVVFFFFFLIIMTPLCSVTNYTTNGDWWWNYSWLYAEHMTHGKKKNLLGFFGNFWFIPYAVQKTKPTQIFFSCFQWKIKLFTATLNSFENVRPANRDHVTMQSLKPHMNLHMQTFPSQCKMYQESLFTLGAERRAYHLNTTLGEPRLPRSPNTSQMRP